ncbi:MAG: cadherin domain-containing protein [Ekhidna sp.]
MMKIRNILLGWVSLLISTIGIGQTLNQAEYFINEDPGVGNGNQLTITGAASLDESFTFSTEGLAVGNHMLYVRTKEAGDSWSFARSIPFFVQDTVKDVAFSEERFIVAAEYFIDTESSAGNGTSIPVTTAGIIDDTFTLDTEGLVPGEHKVFVRTKDDSGIWSLTKELSFYVQDTVLFVPKVQSNFIVAAEYFIDTAVAVGKGIAIPVNIANELDRKFTVQTAGLSTGTHTVFVRTRSNDGLWSLQKQLEFVVTPSEGRFPLPLFTSDTVDVDEVMTITNISDSVDSNTLYKWDVFDDGVVDFTTADISYTFDTTGLIPVRLTAFNDSDSASYLGQVLVGSFTNRSVSVTGSTELCEGDETSLTLPDGYSVFAWNTGDSTQVLTVATAGTYFAWLTDANGFTIKSNSVKVSVSLSINAEVQVQPTSTGQSNGFAQVISSDRNLTYAWSNGTETSFLGGLSEGSYDVTVSNGQCSETFSFTVTEVTPTADDIVKAEYFFDTDPGINMGTALNISNGQGISYAGALPTDGLDVGNHKLYVRTKKSDGLWSLAAQMDFYIQATEAVNPVEDDQLIIAAEYYFNDEPGVGNGVAIDVPNPTASISESLSIETSALPTGPHTLYIRTKSDAGLWSLSKPMQFQNCDAAVDVPVISDTTVCVGTNLVLEAEGLSNHTFLWFDADSVLISNQTASTYNLGTVTEDQTFYVAQKSPDGCQSELARVDITILDVEVYAGLDFTLSEAGEDYQVDSFYPTGGTWTGTGISESGLISRASLNPGNYTYTYTVDSLGCDFSDTRIVTVIDLSETYDITIAENQEQGTVLQQIALDDLQSFEIVNGEQTAILIDENGLITIADSAYFDFEINPTTSWDIVAFQNQENFYSITLIVDLTDAADAPIIVDQSFIINENSTQGAIIGTIDASDQDSPSLTYTLESEDTEGAFSLENTTGVLSILDSALFDFETSNSFELVVSVSDTEFSNSATITVTVNDVNESPLTNDQTISIDENTANGTTVATITGSDPDDDELTFSISDGNTNDAFALDGVTGVISVSDASELDFETTPTFILTVEVSDGELNASGSITINLNDLDENQAPQIANQTFAIDENSVNGTTVGTVAASDPESDELTYSITAGNTNSAFAIDVSTGSITVNNSGELDFETTPTFSLTVDVSDGNLNANATMTINLNDVDETVNQAPQIVDQTFTIDENSENGSVVGTIVASDPDNDELTYSITAGNMNSAFAIDVSTGSITVSNSGELDFETTPTFSLTVEASDGELNANATMTINLNDVDETVNQAPQIADQTFTIDENSENGSVVGTIVASDPDNDELTYAIVGGNTNNAFQINSTNGELIVGNSEALDFEVNSSFNLNILVADAELNTSATITIILNDLDESALSVMDEIAEKLVFYPNPVLHFLKVKYPNELLGGKWSLLDLTGRQLSHGQILNQADEIDVSQLSTGNYILILNKDEISFSLRIKKE